jgi:hypothetical protein
MSRVPPLYIKKTEYRDKWKIHMQRMKVSRIPLQAYKYRLSGRLDIGRPREGGRIRNNIRGRNRSFA